MTSELTFQLTPLGDSAVVVQLGQTINPEIQQKIRALSRYFDQHPFSGMREFVPAFTTVTIFYDPLQISYRAVCEKLETILSAFDTKVDEQARIIEIPVCYGGDYGPDLEFVAEHNGITIETVIEIHSSQDYLVYMIGFAPGFPYLGGMSDRISTPRRKSPRLSIPAGSVGIAGNQTGVYPIETPGGWQVIGRTPLALFRPDQTPPSLLEAGDIIRFRPISSEAYNEWPEASK